MNKYIEIITEGKFKEPTRFLLETLLSILIIIFIGVSLVSAQNDLSITLEPRYYFNNSEIVYSDGANFSSVSFNIQAQNTNPNYPIFNLTFRMVAPLEFREALLNQTFVLGAGETKTLWQSRIINFTNSSGQNISFFVYVAGTKGDGYDVYDGDEITVYFPKITPEDERSFLEKIGELAWQGNPQKGIFLILVLGILFIFLYWKNSGWGITSDINRWWHKLFGKDERDVKRWYGRNVGRDMENMKRWKEREERRRREEAAGEEGWK